MKILLPVLLTASLAASAAELASDDLTLKSIYKVREAKCAKYNVLVKVEYKVAETVPSEIVDGDYPDEDLSVGARAFVKKGLVEYEIPISLEKYQKNGNLLEGKVYRLGSGYCLSNDSFLLEVWSGGSCEQCGLLIKYQINHDESVTEVGLPSNEEVNKALGRK